MLGLRPGDYLIRVNNKSIDRVLTAKSYFKNSKPMGDLNQKRRRDPVLSCS